MLLRASVGLLCLVIGSLAACGQPPGSSQGSATAAEAQPESTSLWRLRVRRELAQLKPPAPPPATGNPVDAFLAAWWKKNGVTPPPLCDDRTYLRRASLDLNGLLPNERELDAFLADRRPDKRERLVGELLANRQAYAEHWMTFWNDLLRNDELQLIEVNRRTITPWLLQSLLDNKPYDEFTAELIGPAINGPVGFIQGVEWKFATSASETPPMQAARSVAQVFQGVNLKCASCHDSFTGPRKLDEAWNMAACFSEKPLEPQRCDKPTGRTATPKFLFAEVGDVPADLPMEMRREAVAMLVTRPRNPRFAKVIVNRLFRQLFGQGIVETVDDLDGQTGFCPELLDYLAFDLMKHDYDLKRTLRLLATSKAYQSVAVHGSVANKTRDEGESLIAPPRAKVTQGDSPILAPQDNITVGSQKSGQSPAPQKLGQSPFAGPRRKRMTAEQFADALATVTGYWPKPELVPAEQAAEAPRAWRHRTPDALATALGRPSRDVINSLRPEAATVLQSLELINGEVLQERLTKGAERLLAGPLGREPDINKVVNTICRRAYSRDATPAEIEQGRMLLGTPQDGPAKRRAGWEDFLWLIVVRGEFQYIE